MALDSKLRIAMALLISVVGSVAGWGAPQNELASERVAQLSAASYQTRESTMQELARDGVDAIVELALAVHSPSPEIRWRAAKLLEDIGISGNEQTLTKVTRVMRLLGEHGAPHLLAKSEGLLARWREAQSDRLIARLKEFGAQVTTYGENEQIFAHSFGFTEDLPEPNAVAAAADQTDDAPESSLTTEELRDAVTAILADTVEADQQALDKVTPAARDANNANDPAGDAVSERVIVAVGANGRAFIQPNGEVLGLDSTGLHTRAVVVNSKWTGGDAEFALLAQVGSVRMLTLQELQLTEAMFDVIGRMPQLQYLLVERCQYDPEAMFAFRKLNDGEENPRSNLTVRIIGTGFLGVMGPLDGSDECVISDVVQDSGAAKAGLQIGDRILAINGQQLSNFQGLITIVACMPVGTEIELEIKRGDEQFKTTATLQPRPPVYD
jgi:hypothetical protein